MSRSISGNREHLLDPSVGPVWLMIAWPVLTTILALTPMFLQISPILR